MLTIWGFQLVHAVLTCVSSVDNAASHLSTSSYDGERSLPAPDQVTITVTEHVIIETAYCSPQQQQLVGVAIAVPVVLLTVLIVTGGALVYCCYRTITGKAGMKKSPTLLQYNNTPLYSERCSG